jgi:hypothetical protein
MVFQLFLFLLVFLLLLGLTHLRPLSLFHHQLSHTKAGVIRTTLQRVLKPRTPLDCPACRLSCSPSSGAGPVPASVRPWCEVKSRRGAPKRVNTEGFACPNAQCPYYGIADAHIHALVGDGKGAAIEHGG